MEGHGINRLILKHGISLSRIARGWAMVYLVGIVSFVVGFLMGQVALAHWLKDRSNEELRKDKSLLIYGMFNWLIAILVTLAGVGLYRMWAG
jgi:uncharacterized membrane protein